MTSGIGSFLVWYAALVMLGIIGLPIARAMLPTLPDRGLCLARPIALLLAGWIWWIGSVLGILPNSRAGVGVAILALVAVAGWLAGREGRPLWAAVARRRRLLAGYEGLFFVSFAAWSVYRAFAPSIETSGGEKYMEMTFISGILASPRFPPTDPWMSGHSISYYYFGYVVAAMLIQLTGVDRFVAFNLIVPMTLGLTLVAAFGLGWNLVALDPTSTRRARAMVGALGATMLALVGNLSGALEVAYRAAWIPRSVAVWLDVRNLTAGANTCGHDDVAYGSLADAAAAGVPLGPLAYLPDRFMWWWRGSRIIHDDCAEIIHEFPFFSFMLADVHPHVMALPYVLTVIGLAVTLAVGAGRRYRGSAPWGPEWLAIGLFVGGLAFMNTWDLPTYALVVVLAYGAWRLAAPPRELGGRGDGVGLAGLVLVAGLFWWAGRAEGGDAAAAPLLHALAPQVRVVVLALAVGLALAAAYSAWRRAFVAREPAMLAAVDTARFGVGLAALAYLLYLPFYGEFASQADGFGLAAHSSRPAQWLIHLGVPTVLATSLVVAVAARVRSARALGAWLASIAAGLGILFVPAAAVSPVVAAIATLVLLGGVPWWLRGRLAPLTSAWLTVAGPIAVALIATRTRATWDPAADSFGTWTPHTPALLALLLIAAVATALESWSAVVEAPAAGRPETGPDEAEGEADQADPAESGLPTAPAPALVPASAAAEVPASAMTLPPGLPPAAGGRAVAELVALVCVAVGALLALGTEFVFVRDLFNNRMNSIFKLSFQTWILFSIGGAYALYMVSRVAARPVRMAWYASVIGLMVLSALYSLGAVLSRTDHLRWHVLATDGPAAWRSSLTLDGLDWWRTMHPGDLAAANWLRANGGRQPVILEASGDSYSHAGRIALATGFPTVLGPHGHEGQWRGTREEIDPRLADVRAFYSTMTAAEMGAMLDRYDVKYVIVGPLEESLYSPPPITLRQIEQVLELVYRHDSTRVYARRSAGASEGGDGGT